MNAGTTLRFAPGVRLHRDDDGTAFLLVPEGVVELSPSALAVVELIDGSRSRNAIVDVLVQRYDAPEDELRDDVTQLCDALRARGFILE